ncbi:MAG: hypothetical protein KatS3mg057_2521 [Herpetosiphonaceae bacterium]|nr:MAG: hypothetical protein KatS3mg057_2521 [Herpetosiphonaceae bacterium]
MSILLFVLIIILVLRHTVAAIFSDLSQAPQQAGCLETILPLVLLLLLLLLWLF